MTSFDHHPHKILSSHDGEEFLWILYLTTSFNTSVSADIILIFLPILTHIFCSLEISFCLCPTQTNFSDILHQWFPLCTLWTVASLFAKREKHFVNCKVPCKLSLFSPIACPLSKSLSFSHIHTLWLLGHMVVLRDYSQHSLLVVFRII